MLDTTTGMLAGATCLLFWATILAAGVHIVLMAGESSTAPSAGNAVVPMRKLADCRKNPPVGATGDCIWRYLNKAMHHKLPGKYKAEPGTRVPLTIVGSKDAVRNSATVAVYVHVRLLLVHRLLRLAALGTALPRQRPLCDRTGGECRHHALTTPPRALCPLPGL